MDLSLLDALLSFALAYSATYVLYGWIRGDPPAHTDDTCYPDAPLTGHELAPQRHTSPPVSHVHGLQRSRPVRERP